VGPSKVHCPKLLVHSIKRVFDRVTNRFVNTAENFAVNDLACPIIDDYFYWFGGFYLFRLNPGHVEKEK
jgi:hypothetical protein